MKAIKLSAKILAAILLLAVAGTCILSISPIYSFSEPTQFSGNQIYNPYQNFDSTIGWERACFHTHTKVDKGINECPEYPDVVYDEYMQYGYGILGFANHQALTPHPYDSALYIGSYEHGYNLFKFHLIPFGAEKVRKFDHLLPLLRSQKQFMIDLLSEDSDMVQFNHPNRTNSVNTKTMQSLTGYRLIEADAGFQEHDYGRGTHLKHWDEALSAGRYCHNIINDDNHNPHRLSRIARRCSWINTPSAAYEDIREQLLAGNFYSTRIPDYGNGDKEIKIAENLSLPGISDIGMRGDTIFMQLSEPAERIDIISQGGSIIDSCLNTAYAQYTMQPENTYIRLTAHYEDGYTIYTNAFARYQEGTESPFVVFEHPVNWPLTILFNLLLLTIFASAIYLIYRLFRPTPRI